MKKIILLVIIFSINAFGSYIPKDKAISMLSNASVEKYKDSNDIRITNDITTLKEDGTGVEINENYRKILTPASQKDNKLEFNYNANYNKLIVEELELIKKDGTIEKLDPKKILVEKISGASQSANIYTTKDKVITGNVPNVEVGDTIYYKTKTEILKTAIEGQYSGAIFLEDTEKNLVGYTELNLPIDKELHIHEVNPRGTKYEEKIVRNKKLKTKSYRWTLKNRPLVIDEPNRDDLSLSINALMFTTIPNWEYVSRWYYELSKPHLTTDNSIRDKVKELTKDAKTRDEKISNIFYWVAKNIRYLGVDGEKNRPGLEPHDVTYTFKTRGGVCRDKATLLTAMLNEAGIESHPILIAAGMRLSKEVPVSWFNHAITVAYGLDGKPQYILDPTDETTKDFLPKYEEDNSYLTATKEGDTLRSTPTSDPKDNNSTANITGRISKDNAMEGQIVWDYTGVADNALRQAAMAYSKDTFDKIIKRLMTKVDPSIVIEKITTSDPEDKNKNFQIIVDYKFPNFITTVGEYRFIPFRGADPSIHFMYGDFNSLFSLKDRNYNFKLGSPASYDININIKLGKNLSKISLPNPVVVDNAGFKSTFTSKIDKEKHTLNTSFHLETKKIHFRKEEYKNLKQEASKLLNNKNLYIIERGEVNEQ